jgi:formate hydrogenlyase subunit 3/multisubunit Na+/H+ antiporter MnhD subunit
MIIEMMLGIPLLLTLGGSIPFLRHRLAAIAPLAALPALLAALWSPPDSMVSFPDWFIGLRLGLDDTGRALVIVTSLLWITAGLADRASTNLAASPSPPWIVVYTGMLTGILGMLMAQDLPTFTLFSALTTFGAYGLMISDNHPAVHQAGLTFLIPAVIAETLLFEAILLISFISGGGDLATLASAIAGAPEHHLIIGLVLIGFGLKVGILPIHFWIPRAYTTVRIPVSAMLSGSMLMAGFLGWTRLLPLGEMAVPGWGLACIITGTIAIVYGIGVGLTQHTPGALLGYILIAQAGLLTTGIGMVLAVPDLWDQINRFLLFHTLHVALAMGALFLGLGVIRQAGPLGKVLQRIILPGLLIPGLSLAGLSMGGSLSVRVMFELTAPATTWFLPLDWLPALAGFGTTLLFGRWLIMIRKPEHEDTLPILSQPRAGLWIPWAVLLTSVIFLGWVVQGALSEDAKSAFLSPTGIWGSLWPILLGVIVSWGIHRTPAQGLMPSLPPGDVVVGFERVCGRVRTWWRGLNREAWKSRPSHMTTPTFLRTASTRLWSGMENVETHLGQWTTLGMSFLILAAMFFTMLLAT